MLLKAPAWNLFLNCLNIRKVNKGLSKHISSAIGRGLRKAIKESYTALISNFSVSLVTTPKKLRMRVHVEQSLQCSNFSI